MPELPEVETVRRGLSQSITGARIKKVTLRRKNLRIPFPLGLAETLAGRTIKSIQRRAKYLLFSFDSDDILIVHLGMSGRFLICHPAPVAGSPSTQEMPQQVRHDSKHDHVVIELADGRVAIFNDARRFGLVTLTTKEQLPTHELFAHLGPEPLEKEFSAAYLKAALAGRKGPIKPVLMDQQLVVGVGNIYASEALFLVGIDPRKPAHKAAKQATPMIEAVCKVLEDAITSGGSSLRDFMHINGESGYFQHRFNVYDRKGEPCVRCKTPIRQLRQAGRSTYYCPTCQK